MNKLLMLIGVLAVALLGVTLLGQEAKDDPHGDISLPCQDCHTTASWNEVRQPMAFRHEETGFPLLGAHKSAECSGCHKNLKFTHIGSACADCHADIHRGQFGFTCQNCHTPENWQNRQDLFNLHAGQGFPLVGAHAIADCRACHIGEQRNEFAGTPVDCQGCHRESFAAASNPNHLLAGFGMDCQSCHIATATSWNKTTYQHSSAFALHGTHTSVQCQTCHAAAYAGTSRECQGCHRADYEAAANPAHVTFGFPTNCEACHNDISWHEAQFDHVQASGFELRGIHQTIQCIQCHVDNRLTGLSRECFGCHENDYNQTGNPNHAQGQFPQDCLLCHNENAWSPSTFDHDQTAFPLSGAHVTLACNSCHQNGQYSGLPADCFSCHQSDYNSVTDPNHVSNNFAHECAQCHNTVRWSEATFDHANTQFPLTGAHLTQPCIACHANGYQNTPTACFACHESDYNNVSDPNHVTNNFNHDCAICHTTAAWSPATFDHNQTQFPLTGAHVTAPCIGCHANGYDNTPTDCYACHTGDYNNVQNPNHRTMGFPTQCLMCHNTTAWSPSSFDHDGPYFPIFSGRHQGRWSTCVDCHLNADDFHAFECIYCHEHNRTDTDGRHTEVPGYQYNSQACYNCHPRGEGGDK